MKHKSRKILVTGAAGFIGSHLCERLVKNGYRVKAFIRYNSRNFAGWLEDSEYKKDIEIVAGDIRNYDSVKTALEGVSVVFHLASLIGIPYSYHSPGSYVDTNIRGTLNLLQAAKELSIEKFIHTSTSEVYGTAQSIPIKETHPIKPQSPYAATKASADFLALSFYCAFNFPVCVIRPFNTYGPRQSARAIIPTIIIQILKGKGCVQLGSLSPTRDFTYVSDTVEGFIRMAESQKTTGQVINIGNDSEISIKDLVHLIARLMHADVKIKIAGERKRPKNSEVERLHADYQKAKVITGWSPKFSLEEGIKQTVAWFEKNREAYKPELYHV